MEINPDRFYSVKEVQELLGLGRVTILRLCQSGTLPASKYGRLWRVLGKDILAEHERRRTRKEVQED